MFILALHLVLKQKIEDRDTIIILAVYVIAKH
jgi:hypothetical protein